MHNHGFYLGLAYGLSAVLLLVEVLALWRRCRKTTRRAAQEDVQ